MHWHTTINTNTITQGKYYDERYDEWNNDAGHGLGNDDYLLVFCATISCCDHMGSYGASQISAQTRLNMILNN